MIRSRTRALGFTTGLLALLIASALTVGSAAAQAGHVQRDSAHQQHRSGHRRTVHPPPATIARSGGALGNPLLGHQGAPLSTIRPSSATSSQALSAFDPNDPVQSGCWDNNAYIAAQAYFPVKGDPLGFVANWYSPDCGTNWAETVVYNDPGVQSEIFYATITDLTTGEQHHYESSINGTYTDMTQSATTTACADGGWVINGVNNGTFVDAACAGVL
jgi:hypothetical protein